jgi:hypothetical protein
VARALLPLGGVDPPQVVLQPLALLAIGRVGQPRSGPMPRISSAFPLITPTRSDAN